MQALRYYDIHDVRTEEIDTPVVKAQDGILEFQTSNYTISIRHRIAAHVEEEGEMVIPCKMLSNITKTLPDAPVTFELSERQVLIGCEKSSFRLNTLDANDFPEFPAYAIESAVELPTDILSEMVSRDARYLDRQGPPHPGWRAHEGREQHRAPGRDRLLPTGRVRYAGRDLDPRRFL